MSRLFNKYILFFGLIILPLSNWATNYYTISDGVFGTGSNWLGGTSPGANYISKETGVNDTVFVRNHMTISTGLTVQGNKMVLLIEPAGSLTITGTGYINAAQIIIDENGLLDFSGTFSTANNAADRITINGNMNVGGDINSAAGTWYIGPNGSLTVGGNILNNDPDMNFTNYGDVNIAYSIDFQSGTWYMGPSSSFYTSGSNILVGSANIVNDGEMKFENATNITTWDGSWDCDGSGSGNVAFAQNVNCATICSGGGSANCEANAVLPVDWLSVQASLKNNKVEVSWSTSSEKNNDFFVVEKSTDAVKWLVVGSVDGSGNSSEVKHYQVTDEEFNQGLVYYRIVQVDFDGQSQNSKTVYVELNLEEELMTNALFPNPNNGQFKLSISKEDVKSLEIYSLQKTVVPHRLDSTNGAIGVSLLNAAKGYYTAVIITGSGIIYKNFLVE